MNKIGIILLIILGAALVVAALYFAPLQQERTDLAVRAQFYCTQENVAHVEVSRGAGFIKVTSRLLGGGSIYYPEDGGQAFDCPVVGPDAMSQECKSVREISDWETICAPASNGELGSLKQPDSQTPTAPICAPAEGEVATITIEEGVPSPRCIQVVPNQMLELSNQTDQTLTMTFAGLGIRLDAGETDRIEIPFGQYLAPGVHRLPLDYYAGSGPEIWLVQENNNNQE